MGSGFDPQNFIGREGELESFERLLSFESAARILAIRAKGGDGKSHLLKKFKHRMLTSPLRPPHSLISFEELPDHSPESLLTRAAQDLSGGIDFDSFLRNEHARLSGDLGTVTALASLQGANLTGAQQVNAAGILVTSPNVQSINISNLKLPLSPLSPEQNEAAKGRSVRYFYQALQEYCAEKPAVIMLDAYEKCDAHLTKWIESDFLEKNFFRTSPACFLSLVVAGQDIPDFRQLLPPEECESRIIPIDGLAKWNREHARNCLSARGNNSESDLDAVYGLIERDTALLEVVTVIEIFSNNPERSHDSAAE